MTRALVGILALAATTALAQTPHHKHYADSPEADKPGPGGELAPRLQNLGAHTLPGDHEVQAGAGSSSTRA